MKVTPSATAASSTACAASGVTVPQSAPSCQVPRPTTLTLRASRSMRRCSMEACSQARPRGALGEQRVELRGPLDEDVGAAQLVAVADAPGDADHAKTA